MPTPQSKSVYTLRAAAPRVLDGSTVFDKEMKPPTVSELALQQNIYVCNVYKSQLISQLDRDVARSKSRPWVSPLQFVYEFHRAIALVL